MSVAVQIDPRSLAAMGRMQEAVAAYSSLSSRAPGKFVSDIAGKLLLGEDVDGGGRNDGLFHLLAKTAPAPGSIRAQAEARKYRMGYTRKSGKPESTSISSARARVDEMLGRGESGAFVRSGGKFGSSLQLATIYQRGRRRGLINTISAGRRVGDPVFATSTELRKLGSLRLTKYLSGPIMPDGSRKSVKMMNRQAAITAIAIDRREASRLSTAVQFLPSRYRKTLVRLKGVVYRSGQAVGMRGGSADMWKSHFTERSLVTNKKGRELGEMMVTAQGKDAHIEIIGKLGLHSAAQQAALTGAFNMVAGYARRRILHHLKGDVEQFRRYIQNR